MPESIGEYRVIGVLGEGGMGIVYEAEQASPRRRVALKVIRGGQFVDETHVKMFQREAETLARLKHPNIGAIYESGRTEDGHHFFAMELVRGETLDRYLAGRADPTAPGELDHRLALFRKICDAVQYAHQRGVIHRDLKPSNIIVTDEGSVSGVTSSRLGSRAAAPTVKILDFGLARITEEDIAMTQITEIGVIKGTLPYMAPEQARGDGEAIDIRTDVYALGVILYEMLAGRRPYDTARSALLEAVRVICEEPPASLSSTWGGGRKLDPDVETIVGTALEKEQDRRYRLGRRALRRHRTLSRVAADPRPAAVGGLSAQEDGLSPPRRLCRIGGRGGGSGGVVGGQHEPLLQGQAGDRNAPGSRRSSRIRWQPS